MTVVAWSGPPTRPAASTVAPTPRHRRYPRRRCVRRRSTCDVPAGPPRSSRPRGYADITTLPVALRTSVAATRSAPRRRPRHAPGPVSRALPPTKGRCRAGRPSPVRAEKPLLHRRARCGLRRAWRSWSPTWRSPCACRHRATRRLSCARAPSRGCATRFPRSSRSGRGARCRSGRDRTRRPTRLARLETNP